MLTLTVFTAVLADDVRTSPSRHVFTAVLADDVRTSPSGPSSRLCRQTTHEPGPSGPSSRLCRQTTYGPAPAGRLHGCAGRRRTDQPQRHVLTAVLADDARTSPQQAGLHGCAGRRSRATRRCDLPRLVRPTIRLARAGWRSSVSTVHRSPRGRRSAHPTRRESLPPEPPGRRYRQPAPPVAAPPAPRLVRRSANCPHPVSRSPGQPATAVMPSARARGHSHDRVGRWGSNGAVRAPAA